ncbi:MAG: hypothetical protein ACI9U2_004223, partial [Bradymonadia bacterium]
DGVEGRRDRAGLQRCERRLGLALGQVEPRLGDDGAEDAHAAIAVLLIL